MHNSILKCDSNISQKNVYSFGDKLLNFPEFRKISQISNYSLRPPVFCIFYIKLRSLNLATNSGHTPALVFWISFGVCFPSGLNPHSTPISCFYPFKPPSLPSVHTLLVLCGKWNLATI